MIKEGDIVKVFPSKQKCKVLEVISKVKAMNMMINDVNWLLRYWRNKYNKKIPSTFDIIVVRFKTSKKRYNYPNYKRCLRKIILQKRAKKKWNNN
ncbi:MAG: hypothetical protein ACTSQJ_00415 [Promethearchaeota archaeon]